MVKLETNVKVRIVGITEDNFDQIPRPANRSFNCQECFYWMEKRDGRRNLVKQKKNWFTKRVGKYNGPLGKLLYLDNQKTPSGFIQFGPISEFGTTRLIYENHLPMPRGGWCVSCVAIQSKYRGNGLATRLVRNVLRDIKNRGVKIVDAYPARKTHSWNQVSHGPVNLWERCGFSEVIELEAPEKGKLLCGSGMVIMRKQW
ncbi:GNAT family N-acetyltransferase [Patescibacteria group bacterium]